LEEKFPLAMVKGRGKNTKFFHRSMIHRCYINRITKLENSQGNTLLDHADIEEDLVTYYKELLSEPPVDRMLAIRKVTQHIPALITLEQNNALMRPIS
jgi:hypothetical protein